MFGASLAPGAWSYLKFFYMSSNIRDFTINARYDLQAPSVQIFYETVSTVNSQRSLSLVKDFYPDPLPTDPQKQFASLQFTVDLQRQPG